MDFIELTDESGSSVFVNINHICSVSEIKQMKKGRMVVGDKAVLGMSYGDCIYVNETLPDVIYGLEVCGATIAHIDGEEKC